MEPSDLPDFSLPDIILPESSPPEPDISTTSDLMPSLADFTLPEPRSIPQVLDGAGVSCQQDAVQSGPEAGKLEGPEKNAQTLGEFKMCKICHIYLNSKTQADMHYAGKVHQKKLRQQALAESLAIIAPDIVPPVTPPNSSSPSAPAKEKSIPLLPHCSVCGLTFTGLGEVQTHLTGARHARKLRELAEKEKLEQAQKEKPVNPSSVPDCFYCKHCDVVCTSQTQLDQHFSGSKHKYVMEAAKNAASCRLTTPPTTATEAEMPASTVYACPPCNVTANSEQQYLQHCASVKHKNKLQNRPGKGKFRDQPYPKRQGAQGKANSPSNTANRSSLGRGNWTKSSSDSFNPKSSFNACRGNGSAGPSRGRGRGTGMPAKSQLNSLLSNFGGGYSRSATGDSWSVGNRSAVGDSWGTGNRSAMDNSWGFSNRRAMGNSWGTGNRSTVGDSWGTDNNIAANVSSRGGGRGRGWQQQPKQWGGTQSMPGRSGIPGLEDNFVRQSFKEQDNY
ncbi:zinc finger protein 346-like [Acanthaster planci]|uniref:Zinc finger protein 346-like n=1 Tax=Acanthaster planci TaxID=133434 RepID=A0A8B7XJR7_ACAPL|nr:zinc finger protein 346-like [Acanthaster planci]XP_022081042.1 zinc finger protein 346-like [Acanthaster planci]XP_022081043.1 zinc finger protein 346-like [Acanthaster planci]